MTENQIKAVIAQVERKYGIRSGLLEAIAYQEYVRAFGWKDDKLLQYHSDGTSFGLFGLRRSTSIAEYNQRHSVDGITTSVQGQANIAGWYLGKRIPEMLKHYGEPVTLKNMIVAYNAGISRVIAGDVPEITADYIQNVREYLEEHHPGWKGLVPWVVGLALVVGVYQIF